MLKFLFILFLFLVYFLYTHEINEHNHLFMKPPPTHHFYHVVPHYDFIWLCH